MHQVTRGIHLQSGLKPMIQAGRGPGFTRWARGENLHPRPCQKWRERKIHWHWHWLWIHASTTNLKLPYVWNILYCKLMSVNILYVSRWHKRVQTADKPLQPWVSTQPREACQSDSTSLRNSICDPFRIHLNMFECSVIICCNLGEITYLRQASCSFLLRVGTPYEVYNTEY